ncbi:hypothetical protein N7510_003440 [Penicillium lagena]|uniref:uncharacterized protein n=1 Tax=Penicillium lagena TaxID=94218 RepID=UPI00253FBAFA|nr:uncharacterized protein N7510_003440 [Penicillium lagena]KAJ5619456.1 hypothetical protein N7510_003440 [Penicillium lagena]
MAAPLRLLGYSTEMTVQDSIHELLELCEVIDGGRKDEMILIVDPCSIEDSEIAFLNQNGDSLEYELDNGLKDGNQCTPSNPGPTSADSFLGPSASDLITEKCNFYSKPGPSFIGHAYLWSLPVRTYMEIIEK